MDDITNEKFKLFILNEEDIKMIIEGLEALKSKDFTGEMMGMMFNSVLKPKASDSPEAHKKWEEHEIKEKRKKEEKEKKQEIINGRIELLKAKLIIMKEMRKEKELEFELKKPERQLE